jgi:DNA helicase IV
MAEIKQLRSVIQELERLNIQTVRLQSIKRIRENLKVIGIGFFIYRRIDGDISKVETQKAIEKNSIETGIKEALKFQKQQLQTIEGSYQFLSKNREKDLLHIIETFEADLVHLKNLKLQDSELISLALGEIEKSRQFVIEYNENLEKTLLRQKLLSLKNEILRAESEYKLHFESERYFSKKELYLWKEKWGSLIAPIREYLIKGVTGIDFQHSLSLILDSYEKGERIIEDRNKLFIEKEILKSELFEKIDGHDLTEEQKRAVIVDEANNLVVAGAGTGKTTALLGKAFYIVSKGLADPQNVLIIAFNKSVVKEIEEKVNIKPDVKFKVKNYHSLGYEVIGCAKGEKPNVPTWAEDKIVLKSIILQIIKNRIKDENFAQLINSYFLFHFNTYKSMFEFTSLGDYYQYLTENEVRALKGHRVKSLEECEIANFLYMNGVNYVYEKPFEEEKTSNAEKPWYKPDFTLTDYGLYIEHFGIDRNQKTAPWVSRAQYIDSMNYKIRLHERLHQPTRLIQTFSFEKQEGNLLEKLEEKLLTYGVKFNPLPKNQLFDKLNEIGKVNILASLIGTFLNLFKSNGESLKTIEDRVKSTDSRTRTFLRIFAVIYDDYMELLRKNGEVDFNDMINQATNLIEQKKYLSPFQYILVDEFQDISQSRKRFLQALLNQNNARLFCVGDDWQSIYRFAGGDISIMTNFEKNFGTCEIRKIQETHRFSDKLCDFSTKFILENPSQMPKKITSKIKDNKPAVTIIKEKTEIALEKIIREINQISNGKEEILIINRYSEIGKPKNINKILNNNSSKLDIEYSTAHKAKGLTVDFVIVIGLRGGALGFPCQIEDDPLLDLVKVSQTQIPNAEERRLFYVALTRAKKHVYLIVDEPYNVSAFISEIENKGYEINTTGQKLKNINCPVCQTGIIIWAQERAWYKCSNSPYCTYIPNSCPKCRENFQEGYNGFLYVNNSNYQCSNDKCSFKSKKCPECENGYLVPKPDRYGRSFLGCSNFGSQGCRHTEEELQSGKHYREYPV